ncbi:serine-rich protein Tye7p [[Candida] jaroonii]|uniref:Serine-rich protein Tye7p n=1 Tax=[Candida] jaroonii TaxID=467808 RepID=A0ACA9Y071_9ASCO|nr:serine-rich protein Tye7p [[Candida] jaroonii]
MNFEFQPLSPVSDNDDWMKYIDSNIIENNSFQSTRSNSFDFENKVPLSNITSYSSIDEPTIKKESNDDSLSSSPQSNYSIDLNMVNNKLNSYDFSSFNMNFNSINNINSNSNLDSAVSTNLNSTLNSSMNSIDLNGSRSTIHKKKKRAPRKKLTTSQKAAHNIIEKKYRININTKIEGLQRLIPWLTGEETGFRTTNCKIQNEDCKKLNKSLILDKAIEYIQFLQINESRILEENDNLKKQVIKLTNIVNN